MGTARALEYHIVQQLLRRRASREVAPPSPVAERLIAILAATAGVFLLGSLLQELLWVLLAAGTVLTLGTRSN